MYSTCRFPRSSRAPTWSSRSPTSSRRETASGRRASPARRERVAARRAAPARTIAAGPHQAGANPSWVCPDQIPRRMLRARPGGGVGNGTVARRRGAQWQESAGGPRGGKSSQKVSDSSTGRRLHRRTNRRPETWVRLNRLEGRAASACAAESRGSQNPDSRVEIEGRMYDAMNTEYTRRSETILER